MELGAVVLVPNHSGMMPDGVAPGPAPRLPEDAVRPLYSPRSPILGNDALQLWIDRIRTLGVQALWLASDSRDRNLIRARFAELTNQGVERLLVVKLKSYAEMDLTDLLRFHCDNRNSVTDAQDSRGPLGVHIFDRLAITLTNDAPLSPCDTTERTGPPYQFRGYTKRILSSQERQDLVADALTGGCAMRPAAHQVQSQVWIAESAAVDESARIIGPAYVGPRSVIHAGATIGPFASVEQDCVVDSGTTIEHSSILPGTHLAAGLLIRESLVDGHCMEHLGWQAVVDLAPAGLARRRPQSIFGGRKPFWARFSTNRVANFERSMESDRNPSRHPAGDCFTRVDL